jgi:hypothetical protein
MPSNSLKNNKTNAKILTGKKAQYRRSLKLYKMQKTNSNMGACFVKRS